MTGTPATDSPKVYRSLRERIRLLHPDMTRGERAIADLILNFPGELAGYSASELANLSRTSKPTVSRFVRRLGFDRFEDMRRLVRDESENGSPLFLPAARPEGAHPGLSDQLGSVARNTAETFANISDADLDALAGRILASRRVWILGYRHSHFLAAYLRWSLAHARPSVQLLPRDGETLGESLVDLGPEDLLILIAMRRSVPVLRAALGHAAGRGCPVAVLADSSFGKLDVPGWQFEVRGRTQGPVDEHVTLMTLLHVLIERALIAGGIATRDRLGQIDDLHADLGEL